MQKIICDLVLQIDHLIPVQSPNFVLINKKKNCHLEDFAGSTHYRVKIKENKKKIDKC